MGEIVGCVLAGWTGLTALILAYGHRLETNKRRRRDFVPASWSRHL